MTPNEREQSHRQATLYLAGALSAEESETFERRLADSQELRDILVQAMEQWSQRWCHVGPQSSWRGRLRRRLQRDRVPTYRWTSLMTSALLGALLASVFVTWLWQRQNALTPASSLSRTEPNVGTKEPSEGGLSHAGPEGIEDSAAVTFVDLTSNERIAMLRQRGSAHRNAQKFALSPTLHTPLLEYLSQPCPKQKPVGM